MPPPLCKAARASRLAVSIEQQQQAGRGSSGALALAASSSRHGPSHLVLAPSAVTGRALCRNHAPAWRLILSIAAVFQVIFHLSAPKPRVRFAGNVGVGGAAAAAAADFGSWPTFASANSAAPHRRPAYRSVLIRFRKGRPSGSDTHCPQGMRHLLRYGYKFKSNII